MGSLLGIPLGLRGFGGVSFGGFSSPPQRLIADFRPVSAAASSLTMRREKITPSSARRENTPASSNSPNRDPIRFGSTPHMTASFASLTGLPCTSRCPYGFASCMSVRISIQRPRAASEHPRNAASARQSRALNLNQGRDWLIGVGSQTLAARAIPNPAPCGQARCAAY